MVSVSYRKMSGLMTSAMKQWKDWVENRKLSMESGSLTAQRPLFQHNQSHQLDLMGVLEACSPFHICKVNRKQNLSWILSFVFKVVYSPVSFLFPFSSFFSIILFSSSIRLYSSVGPVFALIRLGILFSNNWVCKVVDCIVSLNTCLSNSLKLVWTPLTDYSWIFEV